jgi:hypothetical protein
VTDPLAIAAKNSSARTDNVARSGSGPGGSGGSGIDQILQGKRDRNEIRARLKCDMQICRLFRTPYASGRYKSGEFLAIATVFAD